MIGDNSDPKWKRDHSSQPYNAGAWPTRDDMVDVNFSAIVATCRTVIAGTTQPRQLAEFAGDWRDDLVTDRKMHRTPETCSRQSASAKRAWQKRKARTAGMVLLALAVSTQAWAQPAPTSHPFSLKLAIVGVLTASVGAALMLPVGDQYRVLGRTYCKTYDGYTTSIDAGPCAGGYKKVGGILLASGAGVAVLGFHSVTVSPVVTPTSRGVQGRITW